MPLPTGNIIWPPEDEQRRYERIKEDAVWYGGDPQKLMDFYGGSTITPEAGVMKRAIRATVKWLWGQTTNTGEEPENRKHLPVAADIATVSSEQLFAEALICRVEGATDSEGEPLPETVKAQTRLDALLDNCGFESLLLAAAETCSAFGSVGLRIAYDKRQVNMPLITRSDADHVIPEYDWGQLTAVTFWKVVHMQGSHVWRHLERHEKGVIFHGLFQGTADRLGQIVPLSDVTATEGLADLVNEDSAIPTLPDAITAVSIPNMLPDPLDRGNDAGRSDFTPATIGLFDACDRVLTSLLRFIDDGKSRLLVGEDALETLGAGRGVTFDSDQHIFTKLNLPPSEDDKSPITQVQFDMKVAEHLSALSFLVSRTIKSAGYNPQTFGEQDDAATSQTATEYTGKERRSLSTRDKKIRYWQTNLEKILTSLLMIDAEYFGSGVTEFTVKVQFPPSTQPDPLKLAQTINTLKQAEAISLHERVKVQHPDWGDRKIQDEVDAITAENTVVDPITFGQGGKLTP